MNIVVTGASGFVGKNLINYLNDFSNYTISPLSIRGGNSFDTCGDAYVHLAGKAHDIKGNSEDKVYYDANFHLTKELFNHFLNDATAKCFIYVSSVKAVSDSPGDKIVTEDTKETINNIYGKTKKMAEDYILSNLTNQSKRVYILRPCMIHGPGNKGNLNLLYKIVSKGIPWPLGAFENKRSFCSVENLCFVIKELIDSQDIPSGVYNIADSEPISTNELIGMIGVSLKKKSLIFRIPTKIIKTLSYIGDIFHLPLNSEKLKKLTENYEVSNYKLIKALGRELPINSREGMAQTFQSFNTNG